MRKNKSPAVALSTDNAVTIYESVAIAPAEDYGAPLANPVTNYVRPTATLADSATNFETTAVAPSKEYGVPLADPISHYEAPAVAPGEDYGAPAADPLTTYEEENPSVAPGDSYGAPLGDPLSTYEAAQPSLQPLDTYGAPAAELITSFEFEDSLVSPSSQLNVVPLPPNGIKINSPVRSQFTQSTDFKTKVLDSDNYDPFSFQAIRTEEIFNDNSGHVPTNKSLLSKDNDNKSSPGGQNDSPEATRNNKANKLTSGVLQGTFINHPGEKQPLGFKSVQDGSVDNNDVFNQPAVSAATGFAAKLTTTRRPPVAKTTKSTPRRPTVASFQQQFNQPIRTTRPFTSFNNQQQLKQPEKLEIGFKPIKELSSSSGIFFSTPSSVFATSDDFATPRSSQQLRSKDSEEISPGFLKGRTKGQPFRANQIVTTTVRPKTKQAEKSGQIASSSQQTLVTNVTPQTSRARGTSRQQTPRPGGEKSARTQPDQSALTQLRQQLTELKQTGPTLVNRGSVNSPQIPQIGQAGKNDLQENNSVQKFQRLQASKKLNAEERNIAGDSKVKKVENAMMRRNMLMNIILRPGGGDRAKALPRPKVEVNSEGANVILVRLTFPENENIQGLRAFTPTDPKDLEKFATLRESIAGDASVERISATSSEEMGKEDSKEIIDKQPRATKARSSNQIVSNPTRPPRPIKQQKPSFNQVHFDGTVA